MYLSFKGSAEVIPGTLPGNRISRPMLTVFRYLRVIGRIGANQYELIDDSRFAL